MGNVALTSMVRVSITLGMSAFVSLACACPNGVPAGLQSTVVSESMVANGLPMAVLQVSSKVSAKLTIQNVETAWKEGGFEPRRRVAGEWLVVSASSEKCLTTLQLVERNGAFGYLSVSKPDKHKEMLGLELKKLLPAGVDVVSVVETLDQGRTGFTAVLLSDISSVVLRDMWLRQLKRQDWEELKANSIQTGKSADMSERVRGQKGRQQISIVIWNDAQTKAVLSVAEAL